VPETAQQGRGDQAGWAVADDGDVVVVIHRSLQARDGSTAGRGDGRSTVSCAIADVNVA
jgi:hypothetical protein